MSLQSMLRPILRVGTGPHIILCSTPLIKRSPARKINGALSHWAGVGEGDEVTWVSVAVFEEKARARD